MNLIFLGAPGAGKGTQAAKLSKDKKIPHVSTGDILREAVSNKTEIGLKAKEYMDKGALVPDEVVINIVSNRLKENDCKKGFLLDGFPRTLEQAKELDKKLKDLNIKIDCAVYFFVPENELVKRITGRRICKNCGVNYHIEYKKSKKENICDECKGELYQRADDNEETVKKRLSVFNTQSYPLINYYKEKNILKEIDANRDIEEIYKALLAVVN